MAICQTAPSNTATFTGKAGSVLTYQSHVRGEALKTNPKTKEKLYVLLKCNNTCAAKETQNLMLTFKTTTEAEKWQLEMFTFPDPLQQTTDNTQHRDVLLILKGPSLQCVFGSKTSRHPRDFKAFFHNKNTQSVPVNLTISFIQTGKNSVCVCVISLYMYLCSSRCIKMDKVNVQNTYL